MYRFDWNRERYRTRDRLLKYNFVSTPKNRFVTIYPWGNYMIL